MRWLIRCIRAGNNAIASWLGWLLSLSFWPALVLIFSGLGIVFKQDDIVMLLLTIQTSVDAAATKTLQSQVRAADEARESHTQRQLKELRSLVSLAIKSIKANTATNERILDALEGGMYVAQPNRRTRSSGKKARR